MHIRPNATIAAAILLAAIGLSVGTQMGKREIQPAGDTAKLLAALGSSGQ